MLRREMERMKQILTELWVENKPYPLLIFKFVMLFGLLFGSLLLKGYPYTIVLLLCMVSLESTAMKLECHAEYLVAQTSAEKKRRIVWKSILVAGVYALATSLGYVLTISFSGKHHWDRELIVFIPVMTVFLFLSFFCVRMEMSGVISRAKGAMVFDKIDKKFLVDTGVGVVGNFAVYVFCFYFLCRKLGGTGWFQNFGENHWKIDVAIGIVIFILLLRTVYMDYKAVNFDEFYADDEE